ncbi:hypothetical protein cypCar_00029082 [Cyprinus carpio]|nr:hypothetical protein cypCar_00029082 [Cyprinus carpio]
MKRHIGLWAEFRASRHCNATAHARHCGNCEPTRVNFGPSRSRAAVIMALYHYVTQEQLSGFDKYKYSAVDSNPLSIYVMHPFWNSVVKINIPL